MVFRVLSLFSVLNRVSFRGGSLKKSVKVVDERFACVVPKPFGFIKNLIPCIRNEMKLGSSGHYHH